VDVDTLLTATPYLTPVADAVRVYALLTQGDGVGTPPYSLAGAALGLGAIDNGDDTFSLLVSHDIAAGENATRAHGGSGAFVSRWDLRNKHLFIDQGADLATSVSLWEPMSATYVAASSAKSQSLSRLGLAALLSEPPLLLAGEMSGQEGRAFAFDLQREVWELPRLGKATWGSLVANPTGSHTVIAATDDSPIGQIYFYVGDKLAAGTSLEKAGLSNGLLYGLGGPADESESGSASANFYLTKLGDLSKNTGAQLESISETHFLTQFVHPAGGAWDPTHPSDFYFVTSNVRGEPSRLWRLRFKNAADVTLGGSFEMLLDGSEGQVALRGMTIDGRGHVYLLESPGADDHLSRVLRLDAGPVLTPVLEADATRFRGSGANFISNAEDVSGIVDASKVLEPGWFFLTVQVNAGNSGSDVTRGQLLAFYDPRSANTP